MKVAVTGASGFIGRHVMAELSRHDVEVVAVAGPRHGESRPSATGRWIPLDISAPPADCFAALGRPDAVIHLAWAGLPNYRSLHHFETELPIQYNFLGNLVRHGLESLLAVGTCFEYGLQSGPLAASMETRPANPYGFAKDVLRRQLQFLQTQRPFRLTWARLFYLYGDGQSEASLLSQLRQAVAAGLPEFDMSGGEQLRDYLPVTAVAEQLVQLALRPLGAGVVNVCSGEPISVRRLAESWVNDNDWKIKLNFGRRPYPDYEPMAFWGVRSE